MQIDSDSRAECCKGHSTTRMRLSAGYQHTRPDGEIKLLNRPHDTYCAAAAF
jgi:hypothetical protein